jgi:hypothetical protein
LCYRDANQRLSEEPAPVVAPHFRELRNGPICLVLGPVGCGATHPATENNDSHGRELNRRLDLKILVNQSLDKACSLRPEDWRVRTHSSSTIAADGTNDPVVSDVLGRNELEAWFVSERLVNIPSVHAVDSSEEARKGVSTPLPPAAQSDGSSLFHETHGDRRPSRIDPQQRRPARSLAGPAPNARGAGGTTDPQQLYPGCYADLLQECGLHVNHVILDPTSTVARTGQACLSSRYAPIVACEGSLRGFPPQPERALSKCVALAAFTAIAWACSAPSMLTAKRPGCGGERAEKSPASASCGSA